MSSFGFKRKARVIKTGHAHEEEENIPDQDEPEQPVFKAVRKPNRQSGLRKNTAATIDSGVTTSKSPTDSANSNTPEPSDQNEDGGPTVVRPAVNRQGSAKSKRRPKSSRLSFTRAAGDDEGDENDGPAVVAITKKNTLSARAQENSAMRRNVALKGLPVRSIEADEDRPIYSKEYLEELQNSTPATPQNISLQSSSLDGDAMDLDVEELEGALIVNTEDVQPPIETKILTETEIRERKERRARLAQEAENGSDSERDVIRMDEDSDGNDGSMLAALRARKKQKDTRLVREDEDLGEGFDEFVEDGGIALGRKAEREAQRRRKREIADIINAAEGNSADESSDDEAERRIAFEIAQSRAGMEGLEKPAQSAADRDQALLQAPPRLAPIPTLDVCAASLKEQLAAMRRELALKSQQVADLRREQQEVNARKEEVQTLLDEAGLKYQAALGQISEPKENTDGNNTDTLEDGGMPMKQIALGQAPAPFTIERGLENMADAHPGQ
ncbi:hypothetical protein BROUX41_000155 [Berkeleyomyces rouxiae]|uniref:uncharacterized protein n=1 Tax=Berkeleyomyces rouxiae TaxID=2035830 RepID=UPI003B8209D4